jgi:hypothetical protein
MEQKKKRQGEKFWDNLPQAKLYAHLLGAKETAGQLHQMIEHLEMDMALASMDQMPFDAAFAERMEAWEAALFAYKISLYATLHPKHNTCYMGLYGQQVEALLRFYLDLFSLKNWTVKRVRTLWYREGRPALPEAKATQDESAAEQEDDAAAEEELPSIYVKIDWKLPGQKDGFVFKPEKKNDLLCGLELEVEGGAVWPWLKPEMGIQEWANSSGEEPDLLYVEVSAKPINTPDDIHRLPFFKKEKPRRRVGEDWITDKNFGINNAVSPLHRADFLKEKLDASFRIFLDKLFLG